MNCPHCIELMENHQCQDGTLWYVCHHCKIRINKAIENNNKAHDTKVLDYQDITDKIRTPPKPPQAMWRRPFPFDTTS